MDFADKLSRTVWVCINGILSRPGDSDGWTDRAVTWLNTRTAAKAEKWEYATGALTRRFRQQSRARKIARMLGFYQAAGYATILVGHSNGCDLIARVLDLRGESRMYGLPVEAVHLVAPAADWIDFDHALWRCDVRRVHIYGSRSDEALRWAKVSRTLFGWAGLGYGSLGLEGSARAREYPASVFDHSNDALGHSDWWRKNVPFEMTMRALVTNELSFQS